MSEANRPVKYHLGEDVWNQDRIKTAVHDREDRQSVRRMDSLSATFTDSLRTRLTDPRGDRFMRVSWEDYLEFREDSNFKPLSKYMNDILFYTDGTPRKRPIRPLVQNEVGLWMGGPFAGKIVYLKDAGPGDIGDGKYYHFEGVNSAEPTIIQVDEKLAGEYLTDHEALRLVGEVFEEPDPFPVIAPETIAEVVDENTKYVTPEILKELVSPILENGGNPDLVTIKLEPDEVATPEALEFMKACGCHLLAADRRPLV